MNLFKAHWLLFISPFVVFITYIICTNFKWFKKIDILLVRRIYYLLCLIWSFAFTISFYNDLVNSVFIDKAVPNGLNIMWYVFALFVIFVVWDYLFISCRTISDISFGNFNIKTEKYNEMEKMSVSKSQDLIIVSRILQTEYQIISECKKYISEINYETEIDGFSTYKKIIDKYIELRQDIKIDCMQYGENTISQIFSNDYSLSQIDISTIMYCLKKQGICLPLHEKDDEQDKLYAVIRTQYSRFDLLVILTGERIIKSEYLVLQHLISYFDKLLTIDIMQQDITD
jgi:hypothetical protein